LQVKVKGKYRYPCMHVDGVMQFFKRKEKEKCLLGKE